ncbi:MAG TPA: TIR domain-containing protein [Dongiaceae bacterium]|nr:TIR domain-containing protein [Dongiaceae bacterium]
MSLPIRTTIADVEAICAYLATKPTGATSSEAKAVLDSSVLDGRKISAFKFWGLVEDSNGKMRLTDGGRRLAKDKGARQAEVLKEVVRRLPPYAAIIERAVHKAEFVVSATEVAAHWHDHFRSEVSDNDKILNDQAVCFFQLAEGADLGVLTIGRKGSPTRFEFNEVSAESFVQMEHDAGAAEDEQHQRQDEVHNGKPLGRPELSTPDIQSDKGNRVFITHGKNKKILDQVKELVAFGKFEAVVAQERETAAKPVPDKVMDEMRSCQAAVIHVGVEGVLLDKDGNQLPQINGNVLIEIGAAMALYGKNFILLVENGAKLPSNLQGLYECRYTGDELNMEATMKLLKAFNAFR